MGIVFFHALSHYLEDSHQTLRKKAVDYERSHLEEFVRRGLLFRDSCDRDIEEMGKDKTWATSAEIYALSKVFNRPIVVVNDGKLDLDNQSFTENDLINFDGEPIFVQLKENHYTAILIGEDDYFKKEYEKSHRARVARENLERITKSTENIRQLNKTLNKKINSLSKRNSFFEIEWDGRVKSIKENFFDAKKNEENTRTLLNETEEIADFLTNLFVKPKR